jgi:hypothetical protein
MEGNFSWVHKTLVNVGSGTLILLKLVETDSLYDFAAPNKVPQKPVWVLHHTKCQIDLIAKAHIQEAKDFGQEINPDSFSMVFSTDGIYTTEMVENKLD